MYKDTVAFIRERFRQPESFIPLHEPYFGGREEELVLDALRSTVVSSVGKYVDQFEELIASFVGSKFAVATNSGSSALHVALKLVGVEPGTEVITQALTFVATANAIAYANAVPVFVDVDRENMGMGADALREFLESNTERAASGERVNKRTKRRISACVPMHTFGFPCGIGEICSTCEEFNIPLVEDSAESLGSRTGNQHTGTHGKIGIFSFNGNKTVTCGGGGAIVTNDERIAKLAKHLTTTAKLPHRWEYRHDYVGFNYRMPNLNAALACGQMEQLPLILERKRQLASDYQRFFEPLKPNFISEQAGTTANYWLNTIRLNDRVDRDRFLEETNDQNIMTRPVWEPVCGLKMYRHCETDSLENTWWLAERLANIPSSARN